MANFLEKIFTVGRVLREGESLQNPAGWKNFQNVMNSLTVILGAIPIFADIDLTGEQIKYLAGGGAVLMGLYNTYFTVATSTKVGLPTKK